LFEGGKVYCRPIKSEDAPSLRDFWNSLDEQTKYTYTHFNGLTAESIVSAILLRIDSAAGYDYAMWDDDRIVGYGHLDRFEKPEKAHVVKLGIVLAPKHQGRGYGKKLMDYMIDSARKHKIEKIWLSTYADNRRALGLYAECGFQVEGVFRKEEKTADGTYRDIASMALFLTP
jgi:RimJ/RimL family protein N-acetyltransferase